MKKIKFEFRFRRWQGRFTILPVVLVAWSPDSSFDGFSLEAHWLFWGFGLFVDFGASPE